MAGERLSYLLDVYFFTQEDIDLNSQVMLWPEKIRPIFEQSEAVSDTFYPRDAMLAQVLATTSYPRLCLSVCLSQVGVLSKRMNELSWFLQWDLHSTHPILC